jgi:hypothetical protein
MTSKKAIGHYLISLSLAPDANLHCYLMSANQADTLDAASWLLVEAEKLSGQVLLPMVLATPLAADDREAVRAIVAARGAEVQRLLQEADDFHFSIWATHVSDPTDAQLMAMH